MAIVPSALYALQWQSKQGAAGTTPMAISQPTHNAIIQPSR
jgi:hypothetical protein